MHAESCRHDVRESFGAGIVVPIKWNALHFETVYALLACGKGVDALAVCALLERTRLRNCAGGWAANENCAWRAWRAGRGGERVRKELEEKADYMLAMRLDKGSRRRAHPGHRIYPRLPI